MDDRDRARCGGCGDVWVDGAEAGGPLPYGQFRPLGEDDEPIVTMTVESGATRSETVLVADLLGDAVVEAARRRLARPGAVSMRDVMQAAVDAAVAVALSREGQQ